MNILKHNKNYLLNQTLLQINLSHYTCFDAFSVLGSGRCQLEIIAGPLKPPVCCVVLIVEQGINDLELDSQRLSFEVVRFTVRVQSPNNTTNNKAARCPDNQPASCSTTRPKIECPTTRWLLISCKTDDSSGPCTYPRTGHCVFPKAPFLVLDQS